MKDFNIEFPLDDFEKLITQIGWRSLDEWFTFWNLKKEMLSINNFWDDNVKDDWTVSYTHLTLPTNREV